MKNKIKAYIKEWMNFDKVEFIKTDDQYHCFVVTDEYGKVVHLKTDKKKESNDSPFINIYQGINGKFEWVDAMEVFKNN